MLTNIREAGCIARIDKGCQPWYTERMSMYLISLDPGATGGIAIFKGPTLLQVHDMPNMTHKTQTGKPHLMINAVGLANILRKYVGDTEAILEFTSATPQMGVSSAYSFGVSRGIILGVLGALKIPYREVSPQTWKALAGIKVQNGFNMTAAQAKSAGKELARAKVINMFPEFEQEFRLKKDADKADAVLIGMWGLKTQ